ncbi:type II secretion system F family protein [Candidatus Electrothrix sp.]|uniref:type II secretion system F family protein n=1 Tax=Candidatus Electrothrix sp. TaxID=2170559 RepID=UPI00405727A4
MTRLSLRERSTLYRQVAVLLKAGASLPEAVTVLRLEKDMPKIGRIAGKIEKEMAGGVSFAECLHRHEDIFNAALRKILTSGLPDVQKADMLQQAAETEEQFVAVGVTGTALLRSVLWYPLLVLSITGLIAFLLLIFVIPVFEEMFASMGGSLPALTELVVGISRPVTSNPLLSLLAFVALLAGARMLFHRTAEKLPVIGPLLRNIAAAQFAQYFSLLVTAGFSFRESLAGAAESVMNPHYSALLKGLADRTVGISDLSAQMRQSGLFPEMLIQAAAAAKTEERLGAAMGEAATFYSRNISRVATKKIGMLDILVLIIIGLLVGVLVVSMYLPIFTMADAI